MANDRSRRKGRGQSAAAAAPERAAPDDITHPGVPSPLAEGKPEQTTPYGSVPPPERINDDATDPQAVNPIAAAHAAHSAVTAELSILPPAPAPAPAAEVTRAPKTRTSLASRVADAAAAQLLLFDDLPADERPLPNDRVLLVGIVWGNETMIELEQIAKGGDLKVGELFDLPTSNLPKEFRIVRHVGEDSDLLGAQRPDRRGAPHRRQAGRHAGHAGGGRQGAQIRRALHRLLVHRAVGRSGGGADRAAAHP